MDYVMKYVRITILFLFFFVTFSCVPKVIVSKPSPLPQSFYFDKDYYLIFRIPKTVKYPVEKYNYWKGKNSYSSFLNSYTELFHLDDMAYNEYNSAIFSKKIKSSNHPPVILKKPRPRITEVALKAGKSKIVWIKVLIDKTGKILAAQLWDISDYSPSSKNIPLDAHDPLGPWLMKDLTEAEEQMIYEALIAAMNMKFVPAEQNNKSIRVIMTVPFKFKL